MPSLLGLNFLKSKSTKPHIKPSRLQQDIGHKKASGSGYGEQNTSHKKSSESGELAYEQDFPAKASCIGTLEIPREHPEIHKLKGKSSTDDGYGISSKKKTSFSPAEAPLTRQKSLHSTQAHVTRQKGLPSARAPVTRKNFSTVKNVRQDETFTNNESLPAMEKAYRQFIRLYPEYLDTIIVDEIRAKEYAYLSESSHVCLDYSGYGLFSKWQETWHKASASFGLSYISVNLSAHALYGGADAGTAEYDIKQMVAKFLNIQESEYAMVFTASRGSAFKLLGESYPFHLNRKLLSVYDYESDAVKWLEVAAQKRGAEVMCARFRWSSQRLWATDLKQKLLEKRKNKEAAKGLFVFPIQSRVTGAKYSYQWMSQAQENGWDILVDASALGPNAMGSLCLSVFRPDFIVSSFFKVYGSDPTGFGCLLIKRSAIPRLHSSSTARAVGMVRLVPIADGQSRGGEIEEAESATHGSATFKERRQKGSVYVGPSQKVCIAQTYPPAMSGPLVAEPTRVGEDDRVTREGSLVHTQLQRVKKREASCSTSGAVAKEGDQISSNKQSPSLTYPHQKMLSSRDEIKEVHPSDDHQEELDLGTAYDIHQRNCDLRATDRSYLEQSRSSTVFYSPGEIEASSGGVLPVDPLYVQPHVSMSATSVMDDENDLDFDFSEDGSIPFFLEDEGDYEDDASVPPNNRSDEEWDADDDSKEFIMKRKENQIVCRGLEHAHELGLNRTNTRLRCLINWLIASMLKLRHPGSPDSHRLIQIYGPKVNYDRGASVAFNLFDWKGNLLQPLLVQRLADRSNISFGVTTLRNVYVPKSSARWANYVENLNLASVSRGHIVDTRSSEKSPRIDAITIALCFLSNFEDVYRFWVFLANFLDADFVSKEAWRYRSLNQETIVLGEPTMPSSS